MADAPPRQSSSVILARQGRHDVEVFMVRRSPRSEFAADVYVFPGGAVRPDDELVDPALLCGGGSAEAAHRAFLERGGEPPPAPRASLGLLVAGLRELFEEAGVLLAREPDGRPLDALRPDRREALAAARGEVESGRLSLGDLAARQGVCLAWRDLVYFSHWITPRAFPRRFDTRFFVALLPEGQEPLYGVRETTDGIWVSPREALERSARGQFPLVFATSHHLERLAGRRTLDDLLRFARTKPIRTVEPPTRPTPAGPEPYLPDDLADW